jgi:hypothetical protein
MMNDKLICMTQPQLVGYLDVPSSTDRDEFIDRVPACPPPLPLKLLRVPDDDTSAFKDEDESDEVLFEDERMPYLPYFSAIISR